MSGSSRRGSARPPAAAGTRTAAGGRSGSGNRPAAGGRTGSGDQAGQGVLRGPAPDAERLADLLGPVVTAVGLDLDGIRVSSAGRRRLLRIVVDGDGGVSLDNIAKVSREISAALDGATVMGEQPYTLEVSSPGVDRPLTERRHWRRAIGRLVEAPLTADAGDDGAASGDDGAARGTVAGRVTGASADGITIDIDGEIRQFGYSDLGPGKIKIEFAPIDAGPDTEDLEGDDASDDLDDQDLDDEGADEEGSDGY